MARIFITGSSDGLGLMAGRILADSGHEIVLHARSEDRSQAARAALPEAFDVVVGDVTTIAGMHAVAERANAVSRFDAVIHNVAIGYREPRRVETEDGLSHLFAINVLAPYVLTALMQRPDRLVYLSSGMHTGGLPDMDDLQWKRRRWNGSQAYAESKFLDVLLAFGIARRWPKVRSNALEPGWVPTRMGGPGAPDDMVAAPVTQAWLAAGDDPAAAVTGRYFYHQREKTPAPATRFNDLQEALLAHCADVSGVSLP
jgi:NAD(P)-dependent dehydrogenase (short-subunit alcohol dehydrogenase family)